MMYLRLAAIARPVIRTVLLAPLSLPLWPGAQADAATHEPPGSLLRVAQTTAPRRIAQAAPDESAIKATPGDAEVQTWWSRLRLQIQQQMAVVSDVPQDAQVELEVSLLPSGLPADIATRRTSGYPTLDAALRRAVMAATPLPLPADAATYARIRRFAVHYEPRSGVQVTDPRPVPEAAPPAPAAAAVEHLSCRGNSLPAAAPPACQQSGSRNDLLTCFAQAVKARTGQVVNACGLDVYPAEARRQMLEGTTHIGISFDRGGKLSGVSVAESSGVPMLDQRALELVRQSILPAPSELYATPFAVRIPVVFRMQRGDHAAAASADTPAPGETAAAAAGGSVRGATAATPVKKASRPKSATKTKQAPGKAKKKSKKRKKRAPSTQT